MKRTLLIGILATLLISFSLAQISLEEPADYYNLGDKLYVTINGIIGEDSGNLNVDLICDNDVTNLLKISSRAFSTTSEQTYSLPYKYLTKEDLEIENVTIILGNCQLKATMGTNTHNTKTFVISKNLLVDLSKNKALFNPGDNLILAMDVSKQDGNLFNGFYKVSGLFSEEGEIESNKELIFEIPENSEAGEITINVEIYDYDYDRNKQNQQIEEMTIKINQVPTSIITGFSKQTISPEETITLTSELKDQSGEEIKKELILKVKSPTGELEEYTLTSGGFVEIEFPSDATAGIWEVISYYNNNLESELENFEVLEVPKLDYTITGGIVTVTNIGNALYEGNINISIGDHEKIFYVKLQEGLSKTFNLEAPEGEYEINIYGEENSYTESTFLTGNAVSIEDEGRNINYNWIILIVSIIIVLLIAGLWIHKESKKAKEKPAKIKRSRKEKKQEVVQVYQEKEKAKRIKKKGKEFDFKKEGNSAESALVLKGTKSATSIIAINVKNHDSLKPITKENLYGIVTNAIKEKGVLEYKDGFIFVLFNPMVTRTYHNEILAVQAAETINKELETYNKKYKDKVEYGIGVHSGDLVVNKEKNKLQYTGLEDTIPMTKKIATLRDGELLISEAIRNKMLRKIKTEEVDKINTKPIYKVKEIKNLAGDEEKLKDILKRMKND